MLTAPRLDDLTWEDLRQLAQRRIPAASGGVWTHHAPVDPGITLLELFAFLLEQQVYVLDQVPDALARGVLGLLGDAPQPTGIARTVLAASLRDPTGPAGRLDAGSIVLPDSGGLEAPLFSTTTATAVLPVRSAQIAVGGETRAADAIAGPVRLMPADGSPAAFDIVLQLETPPPADVGPLALLLEIAAPPKVAPQWAAAAVDVPPPATLRFARVDGAAAAPLAPEMVNDGTGGLRRAGLLTVAWQNAWAGASEIRLRVATPEATFAAPPRLMRMVANAAIAQHRVARAIVGRAPDRGPFNIARAAIADQLDHWLPLSGTTLDLPADLGPPLEGTVELSLTRDGVAADWRETDELGFAGPADRLFMLERDRAQLVFGNGYAGRIPAPAEDFALRLEVGGGTAGNLTEGLAWTLAEPPAAPPEIVLRNAVPADDGAAAESLADARRRVGGSLERSERVVTAEDIRTLIETMPGLGTHRAHVVPGYDPAFPCSYVPDSIGVFVVPRVPRASEALGAEVPAPRADPGAMALFAERLEQQRMLATRLHVLHPRYHGVNLAVTLRGSPDALAEPAVRDALARHLDAVVGGDGEGWPFGRALRPSELVRVAQDAAGEGLFVESVAVGLNGAAPSDACGDTAIGPNDLVYLAACRITVLPAEEGVA
jgi:predicted phage baseplate assembly protein